MCSRTPFRLARRTGTSCRSAHWWPITAEPAISVVELSPDAILNSLDASIAALGDPIGDPLTVPNFLLFQQAAERSAIVLNGEGGDPCFGGPKNIPMLLADLFGDGEEGDAGDRTLYQRERNYLRAHQKCFDDVPSMLAPDVTASIGANALECQLAPFFADSRWVSLIGKLMAINVAFKGPFHILHKVDALSAVFGVVPRSPLFDRAIVEAAFGIPSRLKLRGSVEKYLLKEAVRDLLPSAIVDRPKSGMLVPVEGWFKGPLLHHARERLIDGLTPLRIVRSNVPRDVAGRAVAGSSSPARDQDLDARDARSLAACDAVALILVQVLSDELANAVDHLDGTRFRPLDPARRSGCATIVGTTRPDPSPRIPRPPASARSCHPVAGPADLASS